MSLIFKKITDTIFRIRYGAIELSNHRYERQAKAVVAQEKKYSAISDSELRQAAIEFKNRHAKSKNLVLKTKDIIEYLAIAREAAKRTVKMQPYEVQVLAGLALYAGKMIEMRPGEGKTLAAVAPVCLYAMSGKGAHVLTFNDYLAERDSNWMQPLYEFLGFSVGFVKQGMSLAEREKAYDCDVTYVTAKEIGFDYLLSLIHI